MAYRHRSVVRTGQAPVPGGGVVSAYLYPTNDAAAVVEAPNYFNDPRFRVGDMIEAVVDRLNTPKVKHYLISSVAAGAIAVSLLAGWALEQAAFDIDFANDRAVSNGALLASSGDGLTFTRNSVKLMDDLSGTYGSVGVNVRGRTNKGALYEPASTNVLTNSGMAGAAAGSPGTMPNAWIPANTLATAFSASGITFNVVSVFQERGLDFIRIRLTTGAGTTTGAASQFILHENAASAAAQNQSWTGSAFLRVAGGSTAGFSVVGLRSRSLATTGAQTSSVQNDYKSILNGNIQRLSIYNTVPADAALVTDRLQQGIQLNWPSGVAIELTLDIGTPQLERDRLSSPIRTTTGGLPRSADSDTATLSSALTSATFCGVFRPLDLLEGGTLVRLGTSSDCLILRIHSTDRTRLQAYSIVGGVAQGSAATAVGSLASDTRYAFAVSYAPGRIALSLNGGAVVAATPAAMPAGMSALAVGGGAFPVNGYIERLACQPFAVSDAELQRLATLATYGG
ncbi:MULTISPECIES: hypothetical protein [unclassified Methylobacterium]|uniref:hypothetical protein n=1 Tax=unclassified Methylobacterium TaxID=2615210 RepID=UPI000CC0F1F9|nr:MULTISPECIES: hypothetical protein [unclassified Methylobacterium]PIU12521.1 MAG: hypothetical protein COT28_14640 [Methylobacterium sp. CG08_land_8_20_14_0_20_71_15]GBU16243.1 hypothetical protein AwMethylo_04580 [Methylobacterium sp.]